MPKTTADLEDEFIKKKIKKKKLEQRRAQIYKDASDLLEKYLDKSQKKKDKLQQEMNSQEGRAAGDFYKKDIKNQLDSIERNNANEKSRLTRDARDRWMTELFNLIKDTKKKTKYENLDNQNIRTKVLRILSNGLVAPRTFSLRADDGRVMYSNVFTRKCSERRTFMRGGTALDLYVEPGASFRGHHWRTMLKTMYADKLPSKFDLYQAHGKVDMAALVDGNMTINKV